MSVVQCISFVYEGSKRAVYLTESITAKDLENILQQSFQNPRRFVGCRQGTVYYLFSSLISGQIWRDTSTDFELVEEASDWIEDSSATSANGSETDGSNPYVLSLTDAIYAARYLTGLEELDCMAVFGQFSLQPHYRRVLSREDYLKLFESLLDILPAKISSKKPRMLDFFSILFDVFDAERKEEIPLSDVGSICAILCSGDDDENLRVIFDLYDADDDGLIRNIDLYKHLLAIYRLMFQLSEESAVIAHCGAADFAKRTYGEVLEIVERSRKAEKLLSYEEFALCWEYVVRTGYNGLVDIPRQPMSPSVTGTPSGSPPNSMMKEERAVSLALGHKRNFSDVISNEDEDEDGDNSEDGGDISFLFEDVGTKPVDLTQAKRVLGLSQLSSAYVMGFIADSSGSGGYISLGQYHLAISRLMGRRYSAMSSRERNAADYTINAIFSVFDPKHTGFCDVVQLCAGLSLFCQGEAASKAQALYVLLNRFASMRQSDALTGLDAGYVMMVLAAMFQVAQEMDEGFLIGKSAGACARSIAFECFPDCLDENAVQQTTVESCFEDVYERFFNDPWEGSVCSESSSAVKQLASISPERMELQYPVNYSPTVLTSNIKHSQESTSSPLPPRPAFSSPAAKSEPSKSGQNTPSTTLLSQSDVVVELRAARDALGLRNYTAEDLMELLADYSSEGRISRLSFGHVFTRLAKREDVDEEVSETLAEEIFDQFDIDGSESVPYVDLTAGMTCLTPSPFDVKLLVCFLLVDEDGDQLLTSADFQRLIFAVLNVVVVCSPTAAARIAQAGVTLETVAQAVAGEADRARKKACNADHGLFSLELFSQISSDCLALADKLCKNR